MVMQTNSKAIARTNSPVIGGTLSIISACISFLFVVLLTIVLPYPYHHGRGVLMIAMLFASMLAVIGGVLAIKRKLWALSLIGVFASIFSVVGLLGIIATVLISTSKKEFNNPSSAQL
jgi:predicted ferric reductase